MKKILSILILLSSATAAFADTHVRTDASLKSAMVYLRGACLEYSAKAELKAGAQILEIAGLSAEIDKSSLRIGANSGILVSSVEFASGSVADGSVKRSLKQMRDSLELLDKRIHETSSRIQITNSMISMLETGVENSLKSGTTSSISSNLEYYRKQAEGLYKTLDADEIALEKLQEMSSSLSSRIEEAEAVLERSCTVLKLSLSVPSACSADFGIKVFTNAASWTPFYEINAESTSKPLKLLARAKLSQKTGLDWNKVKLSLSSGRPDRTSVAPELSPWRLGFRTYVVRGAVMAKSNAAVLRAEAVEESALADAGVAQTVESGLELSYVISLPYDIPGDGSVRNIDLKTYDIPAVYRHYAAPRLSEKVYLTAEISDWGGLRLLPGQASVNYDGAYAGKTRIEADGTSAFTRLTLAEDPSISIKRERSEDFKGTSTIGSNTIVNSGWKISVRNNGKKTVDMVLCDQVPVSSDKEIDVKVTKTEPAASETDQAKGFYTWKFQLAPGKAENFELGYKVKYPSDKALDSSL